MTPPPPRHSPDNQLEFVLHAVSRSLARTYNEQFRKLDLSQSQAGVLLQIDWGGPATQTEIAQRLGIKKAATGELIIDLEGRGLVRRERHAGDARKIEVTLTPAGRRKVKRINDFVERLGPLLRDGIDETEMRRALAVLAKVRANVETIAAHEAAEAAGAASAS
ncbi:MAG: MarR family transcriptional regulator [Actinobacteria bacterium]|nr:MarR family transcriptional regulator [Actinomycetota bacterium]MBV9664531.1 MarR family transcriptional regulator [Actinomycetota bacterium]MBV9936177.1 MarR family transcriptional regulator [Actinomycetota bacterium]